jgi:hypothetical protein
MLLHQLQVLVPRFLGVRLEDTARHEVVPHPVIIPGGVEVVLRLVEGLQDGVGAGGNQARERVGDGAREGITGILVGVVMAFGEEDQLLPGSFRLHNPLFEKELAETGLVPRLEGGVLEVLEGFLSVVVLFVAPRGIRPPVLGHKVLEVLLRVVEGFRDIDLVLFKPGL